VRFDPRRALSRQARVYLLNIAISYVRDGVSLEDAGVLAFQAAVSAGLVTDTEPQREAAARAILREARRWAR